MAVMFVERLLRDEQGNSLEISVPANSRVEVLATNPPLMKIKALELPNQPIGFVTIGAVNTSADAPPTNVLDKDRFAKNCAGQEDLYGVSAHYLMSVAALRTNITRGPVADRPGETGPFAISLPEWKFFCAKPEFSLGYGDADIDSWSAQCDVFAVITYLAQNKIASLLREQPTSIQLYLSQLLGTSAAVAGIRNQVQTIGDLIKGVSAAEFQAEAIDPGQIIARWGDLLKNSATIKDTLSVLATQFQKALDDTKPFLAAYDAQPILSTDKPPPTNLRTKLARNQWTAYQASLGEGLRDVAGRALVANMTGESLGNPTDEHDDDSHMTQGIVQWDTPRSEAIRDQFGSFPKQLSVKDQTRAAIWEIRTVTDYALTKNAIETGQRAEDIISALVRNYERPLDKAGAIKTRITYLQNVSRVVDQMAIT